MVRLSARLDNKQAGRATIRVRRPLRRNHAPLKDEEPLIQRRSPRSLIEARRVTGWRCPSCLESAPPSTRVFLTDFLEVIPQLSPSQQQGAGLHLTSRDSVRLVSDPRWEGLTGLPPSRPRERQSPQPSTSTPKKPWPGEPKNSTPPGRSTASSWPALTAGPEDVAHTYTGHESAGYAPRTTIPTPETVTRVPGPPKSTFTHTSP